MRKVYVNISLPFLFLLSFVLVSETARSKFGVDFSLVFVVLTIVCYFAFYRNFISDARFYTWWIYIFLVPTLWMTLSSNGNMKEMITCALILLLPIALECFVPVYDEDIVSGCVLIFALSMIILFLYANVGFLRYWNTNCISYLLFLGVCSATILLSLNRGNIFVWLIYIYAAVQLLVADSRNVSISVVITMVLILLKSILTRKCIFRCVYIFAILYSAIFYHITQMVVDTKLYDWLLKITTDVYDKGQGGVFNGRVGIYEGALELINDSFINNIFGYGRTLVSFYASHNDYYLIRYTFGIIGTLLIGYMLVRFFEAARKLIVAGDNITYGCTAIIISVLFQQASEGWFLATNLLTLMPFVYMAIVIKRYRKLWMGERI